MRLLPLEVLHQLLLSYTHALIRPTLLPGNHGEKHLLGDLVIRRPVPFHWIKNGLALVYKLHWKEFFRFTDSLQNLGVKLSLTNVQAARADPDNLTTGDIPARKGGTRELTGNAELDKLDALDDLGTEASPTTSQSAIHRAQCAARGRNIEKETLAMLHVLAGWDEAMQSKMVLEKEDDEGAEAAALAAAALYDEDNNANNVDKSLEALMNRTDADGEEARRMYRLRKAWQAWQIHVKDGFEGFTDRASGTGEGEEEQQEELIDRLPEGDLKSWLLTFKARKKDAPVMNYSRRQSAMFDVYRAWLRRYDTVGPHTALGHVSAQPEQFLR